MVKPKPIDDPQDWNRRIISLPGAHLLQSREWGDHKQKYGWQVDRLAWEEGHGTTLAAAQILQRPLRGSGIASRLSVMYCPKGPLLNWDEPDLRAQVLTDLQNLAARRDTIFLKIDPEVALAPRPESFEGLRLPGGPPKSTPKMNPNRLPADGESDEPSAQPDSTGHQIISELTHRGWLDSPEQIQFRNTMHLDLRGSEEDLLAGMKQKTRYNIRLAARKGVVVVPGGLADIDTLYRLYAETSVRDGFVIRPPAYYRDAWGAFIRRGLAQPFLAEVDGKPVAGLVVYRFADKAWYLYGMSSNLHRDKMPNHLLQWEAIRWARRQGCKTYDFWGAPDQLQASDPMWGVYRFKRGFGGRFMRTIGAWDYPVHRSLYRLYIRLMPRLLAMMRLRGQAQTRNALE